MQVIDPSSNHEPARLDEPLVAPLLTAIEGIRNAGPQRGVDFYDCIGLALGSRLASGERFVPHWSVAFLHAIRYPERYPPRSYSPVRDLTPCQIAELRERMAILKTMIGYGYLSYETGRVQTVLALLLSEGLVAAFDAGARRVCGDDLLSFIAQAEPKSPGAGGRKRRNGSQRCGSA